MKSSIVALGLVTLTAVSANAGGIDRGSVGLSAIFEPGRVLTLGFSSISPSISGQYDHPLLGALPTGDIAVDYSTFSLSFKDDINDRLTYGLFVNQPYGAETAYEQGLYTGLEAKWSSTQFAGILQYNLDQGASVYGGLRYVVSDAEITVPAQLLSPPTTPIVVGPYTASAERDGEFGYILGAAYEIPDIALRVALTYESAVTHVFRTSETFGGLNGGATLQGSTSVTLPQSVILDFQTGIASDMLLFGSVKWAEWSAWHVRPTYYDSVLNAAVTGFADNTITYSLGIGKQLNEHLSVFARVGYEAAGDAVASSLSPSGAMKSIGVGASWMHEQFRITGGLEYVTLGDAVDAAGTRFEGSRAIGIGIQTAITF